MMSIRTIIHPTDFSSPAEAALDYACALARDYGARLIVLHVWMPPPMIYGNGIMPLPAPDLREELKLRLQNLPIPAPLIPLERRFVEGSAVDGIVREAQKSHCDLIVMGTRGWTGLSRLFMGSVAEGVLRRAPCPVLTVRTPLPKPNGETASTLANTEATVAAMNTPGAV